MTAAPTWSVMLQTFEVKWPLDVMREQEYLNFGAEVDEYIDGVVRAASAKLRDCIVKRMRSCQARDCTAPLKITILVGCWDAGEHSQDSDSASDYSVECNFVPQETFRLIHSNAPGLSETEIEESEPEAPEPVPTDQPVCTDIVLAPEAEPVQYIADSPQPSANAHEPADEGERKRLRRANAFVEDSVTLALEQEVFPSEFQRSFGDVIATLDDN